MIEVILCISVIIIACICILMQTKIETLQKHVDWLRNDTVANSLKLIELERKNSDD